MILDLVKATSRAIESLRHSRVRTDKFHEQVRKMYSWTDVAARTERVYNHISNMYSLPLIERLKRYYGCGLFAGNLFCFLVAVDFLLLLCLQWLWPERKIDKAKGLTKFALARVADRMKDSQETRQEIEIADIRTIDDDMDIVVEAVIDRGAAQRHGFPANS